MKLFGFGKDAAKPLKRGAAKRMAESIYESAIYATGRQKIDYAKQYLDIYERRHPEDDGNDVRLCAWDMATQEISRSDVQTKAALYPILRQMWPGSDSDITLRRNLLGEE